MGAFGEDEPAVRRRREAEEQRRRNDGRRRAAVQRTCISTACRWYSNSAASDSFCSMSSYVGAGVLRPWLS